MCRSAARLAALAALIVGALAPAAAFDPAKVGSPNYNRLGAERLTIQGSGSTGDVSGMSVLPDAGAAADSLARRLHAPIFPGPVTTPSLNLSGSGSTGDVSGMSVAPPNATAAPLSSLLGFTPRINSGVVSLLNGPTLGTWQGGKYVATPDSLQIQGFGSTGDVSGMSVTVAGATRALSSWLPLLAPQANPIFSGTATVPVLTLTSPGSTGDVSAMSVVPSAAAAADSLARRLHTPTFTGPVATPSIALGGSGSTGDVSGMSVTSGGATRSLSTWLPLLAPLSSPTFTGTVTAPSLSISGTGSAGDVSGMSVTPSPSAPAGSLAKWFHSPSFPGPITAGDCDTSQWAGGYLNGTASPILSCYATKQAKDISIPFPAVIGIGPENISDPLLQPNDQTYIQLAQHLIQARTTQGDMRQESGLVVNFDSRSGKGAQTNHGQKVGLYVPTLARPGAGNTWAFNPALTILDGVGNQSMYNTEMDITNFNGPYQPGGSLGNAAMVFRTHTGFPITASELWSGETPPASSLSATTTAGSTTITFSGRLHVGDRVSGPGIPTTATVSSIGGSNAAVNVLSGTAILSAPATASASGVSLTRKTYNMVDGHLYQGDTLIRDNTLHDGTSSLTSIRIAGTHQVGIDTTIGTMPYAMLSAAGQRTCLNALDACWYTSGTTLLYEQGGSVPLRLIGGVSGGNGVSMTTAGAGFGPIIAPDGADTNVPLNLRGKGTGVVQVLSPLTVTGRVTLQAPTKLATYTVAGLPTCNAAAQDTMAAVTDATAPTYRGALTGGGAVRTPVYCDGTSWTAH